MCVLQPTTALWCVLLLLGTGTLAPRPTSTPGGTQQQAAGSPCLAAWVTPPTSQQRHHSQKLPQQQAERTRAAPPAPAAAVATLLPGALPVLTALTSRQAVAAAPRAPPYPHPAGG